MLSVTGKDGCTSTRPSAADSQQAPSSSPSACAAIASNLPINTAAASLKSDKTNNKLQTDNKPVIRPPTKLELIKYEKTSSLCHGVSWREDGNILCSTDKDGIEVRSGTDLSPMKKINITGYVCSAYTAGDQLITKVGDYPTVSIYIGTESNPQHTLLHKYKGYLYSQLSVSDSMIADIDRANKQLMIYTITGNHLYNIDIRDMSRPDGVHILPAGESVLVSNCGWRGEVRKYKLQADTHHQPVWICTGLCWPQGITSDQSGLIYVVSFVAKKIYQISPQGWFFTVCCSILWNNIGITLCDSGLTILLLALKITMNTL